MNAPQPARAVVLSAVRTPVGRYGGELAGVRPDDLAALALRAAVDRAGVDRGDDRRRLPRLREPGRRGQPQRRADGRAARRACPSPCPGVTVNRLCASGLSAVVEACRAIAAGEGDLFVAGGVESMSRAPLVMAKARRAVPARQPRRPTTRTLGWRFPNPRDGGPVPARVDGRDRRERRRALGRVARGPGRVRAALAAALGGGRRGRALRRRARARRRRRAGRAPAAADHRREARDAEAGLPLRRQVTAGNSSGLNDGAAALVVASEARARDLGAEPLGAFVGSAAAGVDPRVMGIGPVPAVRKLLGTHGRAVERHRPRRAQRGVRVAVRSPSSASSASTPSAST